MSAKAFKQACLIVAEQERQIEDMAAALHTAEQRVESLCAAYKSMQEKELEDFGLISDLRAEAGRLSKALEAERGARGAEGSPVFMQSRINEQGDLIRTLKYQTEQWQQREAGLRAELARWRRGELKAVAPVSQPVSDAGDTGEGVIT